MSTAAERAAHLELVGRLKSAYPEMPDAPPPDLLDHERFLAYMKTVHDVGGEPDAPMKYENKDYEYWEHMTYVICEVLAWRGIWLSEERRRIGNVDVGRAVYQGFPYYGRWLWAVARVLVEKHHISLGELTQRMVEVQGRYEGGLAGRKLEAQPKSEGDGADIKRNEHHIRAVGKGDPQVYAGQAGEPKFRVCDAVVVRELPILLYTRTPEYVRGARGEIAEVTYESPAAEDETWDRADAPGVVLHRALQPVRAVARLHRHGHRHPADRDSRALAGEGLMTDHHDHDHDHARTVKPMVDEITDFEVLEIALRELCIEKGIFTAEEHRRFTEFAEQIGPTPAARLVARAWLDPDFKKLALTDALAASKAVGVDWLEPTGFGTPSDFTAFKILEDTPTLHNVIVCALCSCYPRPILGNSPEWYRTPNYRRRLVRWPRQVLAEFGLYLPDDVEVRVEDSNQKHRFMVMPMRPEGTEGWDEDQLAEIITRDCLIGVALPKPGVTTNVVVDTRAAVHPAE